LLFNFVYIPHLADVNAHGLAISAACRHKTKLVVAVF
jgi:hypothetical protein